MSQPLRRIGPYRILEVLGSGAMGVVYRCEHVGTLQLAALKTVALAQRDDLQAIRHEIAVLRRIRHPGIVQILDDGIEDGVPWYAMELLEGLTLRQHLDALFDRVAAAPRHVGDPSEPPGGTLRIPLSRVRVSRPAAGPDHEAPRAAAAGGRLPAALTLARQLCGALAFLHGEGLVHRDLKPDNILLRPDGTPVLVDFGLAAQLAGARGREQAEAFDFIAGTPAYMAPEQLRGEDLDARGDLYSLGCILYELLTGRPPFVADSDMDVARAQMQDEPLPASHRVAGVPPQLDALAAKLLQKHPRDRLGYAEDVGAALGRLGSGATLETPGPRPRAYLYRPALTGRDLELGELERDLERVAAGSGAAVFVNGESGAGKTRLAMEVARRARRRGIRIVLGECAADGSARAPLGPLRGVLRCVADECRLRGVEGYRHLLRGRARLLAAYEPQLATVPGGESEPEPAALPPDASRLRLVRALADTLVALAGSAPTLLVLDDLQWADELTLEVIGLLLRSRRLEKAPLLVLGTYRTAELSPELERQLDEGGTKRLSLGRLDRAAVGRMAADMLAFSAPPVLLAEFLSRQSEGNPFFVIEYLGTAIHSGLLWRDGAGRWQVAEPGDTSADTAVYEALPLPRSIRELVGRHLEALSPGAKALANAAAVLGREAEGSVLASMTGLDGAKLLDGILELLSRQVMEEAGRGRLRFTHDKLREVAHEQLDAAARRQLHRRAAEVLEARPADRKQPPLAALARHWEQAEEPAKARAVALAAARQAAGRHALDEAAELYRTVLRLSEASSVETPQVRLELARDVLTIQGRLDLALQQQELALDEARTLGDPDLEGKVLSEMGECLRSLGNLQRARDCFENAIRLQRRAADRAPLAATLGRLGWLHHLKGRSQEAVELTTEARGLAQELGDASAAATLLGNLAVFQKVRGEREEARALYERVIDLHDGAGDFQAAAVQRSRLAQLHHEQGRLHQAQELTESGLETARSSGDRQAEARMLGQLGLIAYDRGELEKARSWFETALEIAREVANRRAVGVWLFNLGVLLIDQGLLQEAEQAMNEALGIHCALGNRRFEASTLCSLARLWHLQGRLELASSGFERALEILSQAGERRYEGFARGVLAHLRWDQGRVQEAREALNEALQIHRDLGEQRFEALSGVLLGRFLRLGDGKLDEATALLEHCERLAQEAGAIGALCECLAERFHIGLAMGAPEPGLLAEAIRLSAQNRPLPDGSMAPFLLRAQQALDDHEAGRPLFRGERVRDIPAGLRGWLAETGQLALDASQA